jgi:hypothetical protein
MKRLGNFVEKLFRKKMDQTTKRARTESSQDEDLSSGSEDEDLSSSSKALQRDEVLDYGELISKQGVTSKLWTHFKVWSKHPDVVSCVHCKMNIKVGRSRSTSNMERHIPYGNLVTPG